NSMIPKPQTVSAKATPEKPARCAKETNSCNVLSLPPGILKGVRPVCLLKGASSFDDLIFELGPAIHVNPVMRQEEERAKGCSIFIPDQLIGCLQHHGKDGGVDHFHGIGKLMLVIVIVVRGGDEIVLSSQIEDNIQNAVALRLVLFRHHRVNAIA
ncbi:hypothetical protein AKJ16_DCAP18877, partial [Drosera capensis]